ncbi:MAG: PolC-type DNA polymerase III [Firmicutes bacterium]|nr:PolC-type DNA polymerase III [Bacillota bacterium]
MADNRFEEWRRAQGWDAAWIQVHAVERDGDGICVWYHGSLPDAELPRLRQLAEELSKAWQCPVRFALRAPDQGDWQEQILALFREGQPGLAAALAHQGELTMAEGRVCLRFPDRVTEAVFQRWGGVARLKRSLTWLREMAIDVSVKELPPPIAAEPVVVSSVKETPQVLGQEVDPGDVIRLDQLPPQGEVTVSGRIFRREVRETRDGSRHYIWTITDETSAVRLRYSERRGQVTLPEDFWPEGAYVAVRGVLEVDKYSDEIQLRVKSGQVIAKPPLWGSPGRPRVELHVHSKMSAMDGLISPKELFEAAREAHMPAVAIVDHGVVQTYPEAQSLERTTGVRAIYGVEVNMVDTELSPWLGAHWGDWEERPFVVVDVETTGLSPRRHQVIELGAVKVQGGEVVDRFHRLVRPTRSVSEATRRITRIGDDELAAGVAEDEMWEAFFAFSEGAWIAAHNARFDLGFLRWAYERLRPGHSYEPLVLDTLTLARIVLPGLKSYGLEALTDHYKIGLTQHHRALDDAEATAQLALRLLAELRAQFPGYEPGQRLPVSYTVGRPTPVVLLVKRNEGLVHLYRLISASHLTYFHRVPRVPRSLIDEGREHWLVGSPFHDGEVADALFRHASAAERDAITRFYDYWEIVPPTAAESLTSEEMLDGQPALESFLGELVSWGRQAQKPVVAVSDAHYLRPQHHVYREVLAATAKGELHHAADRLYLRSGQEMEEELAFLTDSDREWVIFEAPLAIQNELEPIQPVPSGLFSPHLPEAEQVVAEESVNRAKALYGDPLPEIVAQRLEKEVHSIVSHGFSSIYYIAHRLVQKSLDDGYLVGSRGSVGSSLVATLLNITEVNPLPPHYRCPQCRWTAFVNDPAVGSGFDLPPRACPVCQTPLVGDGQDIPFETFLGFEGDKVPDIDLNFSGDYQPEIHRYTEVLFGQGHVFRAGTIATVADKTAFGLVKAWARETGRTLTGAAIDWLASALTGVKRTTGQHPGGLMVVPQDEDIHHFTPVQHPADDRGSEVITTHFDYHSIEGRLLKLDLLGHDDPTAIRMLEDLTGIPARAVPFHDEATMSLFRDVSALGVKPEEIGTPVGSLGIPEFGTRFVRQMLVETRPRTFAELVRISGLSHGTEVWTNNAQELIRQRIATLSEVIATRDDIMTYLLSRGLAPKIAFSISESVRKGKGLSEEQVGVMKDHGVPDWYIDSCRRISYLFPKAHAAAYVMMGWRIAWYKVHHPLAYYATYFSVRADDFDAETVLGGLRRVNHTLAAIEEKGQEASPKERNLVTVLEVAREMLARGYRFYPIDLERSHATRFLIEHDGLIIPFAALPGLGVTAARHIIEARETQPFLSIDDLRQRARLSKSIVELLKKHGALQHLGETSQLGFF